MAPKVKRRSKEMLVGLRGERQCLLHFPLGLWCRARPGQSERPLPGKTWGANMGSSRRPRLRGGGGRRGEEGVRDGSPSSGRGGAWLQTAESNECRVKRWDERDGKSETPRRGPVKRKKPSELKRREGQKKKKKTERERGDPQGRNGSSANKQGTAG